MKRSWLVFFTTIAILFTSQNILAQDAGIWQGQYYTGTTFNVGTYEFNFTIYDASTGGSTCYSNTETITTGDFGEWYTEQEDVGSVCNNASKEYYLNINIDGQDQVPRKRLVIWNFLRKDAAETITKPLTYMAPIMASGTLNISAGTIEHTINQSGFMRFIERNLDSGPDTVIIHTLENDRGYQFNMALTSSNFNTTGPNRTNQGVMSLNSPGEMSFLIRYNQPFAWRINPFNDGNLLTQNTIMRLEPNGDLFLDYGGMQVNKSISAVGNMTAAYFIGNGSLLTGISASSTNDTRWNITASNYLVNNSGILELNETTLNNTILARAGIYNDTALISAINTSLLAQITASGNASFNQSVTDASYTPIMWNYNQTVPSLSYINALIASNNNSWLSTFNATYASSIANNSWNQSIATLLYAGVQWGYNQTLPVITYSESRFLNLSGTNANQNIQITPYNLTASSGMFSQLGSSANRVTTLFAQNINASNNIATTQNVSARGYIANNNVGITSSSFSVCSAFLLGACTSWCTLQINGGIITGCT